MTTHASVSVTPEPLDGAEARRLVGLLNAELVERHPAPEDNHFELTGEQVADGHGVFLVARIDGDAVGCAALRRLDPATGEIERMYVSPSARGARIGARFLSELEHHAKHLGLTRLVLETGPQQPEALRLYERAGFTQIPAFGEYVGSTASICMGKFLT